MDPGTSRGPSGFSRVRHGELEILSHFWNCWLGVDDRVTMCSTGLISANLFFDSVIPCKSNLRYCRGHNGMRSFDPSHPTPSAKHPLPHTLCHTPSATHPLDLLAPVPRLPSPRKPCATLNWFLTVSTRYGPLIVRPSRDCGSKARVGEKRSIRKVSCSSRKLPGSLDVLRSDEGGHFGRLIDRTRIHEHSSCIPRLGHEGNLVGTTDLIPEIQLL
mmetsp:Transcript_26049/g.102317  ORF Transcript_26049/g.102317 Transcript_26049/m.102317 type:complete len:216 (-) Transcript_26049:2430-3077(-)